MALISSGFPGWGGVVSEVIRIASALREPAIALVEPTKRVFLPFILGAGLIAALIWLVRLRRRVPLLAFLFPRAIWLHPSALLDYRLMFARAVLHAALLGPFVVTATTTAVFVGGNLRGTFGAGPAWDVGRGTVLALFTLFAFVGDDFGRFMVHMLAHRVPALWELHKVHHSAEVMTPFTVYRTHPIESVIMRSGAAIGVGIVAGVMSFCFRGPISGWEILGVDAIGLAWNAFGSNLRHSHVWLSYGRVLEHVFISPAQHQIHHSDQRRHFHTNFGSTFAFWDWIGRSLYVTHGREPLRFGLPPDEQNHGPTVLSAWFAPMAAIFRSRKPALEGASARLLLGLLVASVVLASGAVGCRRVIPEPTGDPPVGDGGGIKRSDALTAFGACAYDLGREFRERAEILEGRTATYAASPTPENLAVARASWEDAIDLWERVEVFQFGPAAPFSEPGGKDLRSQIYSWPSVTRCAIEQGIVGRAYDLPDFVDAPTSTRGLYATEYLLFYGGTDNVCGPSSVINTSGSWDALGTSGLAARKAGYAHAAALDLVTRARALETAWSPAGGNFVGQLATAGTSTSIYPTQQLAFNAVSDALFYIEISTKDAKIGKPSGVRDCPTETCPEALESPWARRSKRHVRSNLVGGKMLVFGCDEAGTQVGFDDLLRSIGQGAIADRLRIAFDEAIAAVDAIPDPDLDATIARDPQVVRALYVTVKKITDILRTDFVTALVLEIPTRIQGDND